MGKWGPMNLVASVLGHALHNSPTRMYTQTISHSCYDIMTRLWRSVLTQRRAQCDIQERDDCSELHSNDMQMNGNRSSWVSVCHNSPITLQRTVLLSYTGCRNNHPVTLLKPNRVPLRSRGVQHGLFGHFEEPMWTLKYLSTHLHYNFDIIVLRV